ncbi:sigma-70 family RNA polymerase sigma factor [Luteimonas aestuarii]|uniref:Sigma-70 family RNA polymerase sigma factor n=1 Tax=Luteimonas aestuarii TaxID=453837 RepID=A0A4R5U1N2_9GAMM|nr:sigma-70 family RNA polymerase sigma factor [Luteimonas aestuarii]TDK27432.1 sigma-70 family RNA polymerase sigma factor [Luteimonas aestuarii]
MELDDADAPSQPHLLKLARQGNAGAFEQLYRLHAPAVFTLALRLTGNRAAAEDIVQDTFLRMFGFLTGLRTDTPLRPWLKRVAANLAIDRLRRERRYGDDERLGSMESAGTVHADSVEAEALLRRLSPLARTLLWLHEIEGWSHTELARRFGRSESWSKSILSRALARLREDMDPGDDDA